MSRLAALALAGVLLSGCEAHFSLGSSSPELAKAKLEAGLKDAITEKTGVTLTSVSCDGPLKGRRVPHSAAPSSTARVRRSVSP